MGGGRAVLQKRRANPAVRDLSLIIKYVICRAGQGFCKFDLENDSGTYLSDTLKEKSTNRSQNTRYKANFSILLYMCLLLRVLKYIEPKLPTL